MQCFGVKDVARENVGSDFAVIYIKVQNDVRGEISSSFFSTSQASSLSSRGTYLPLSMRQTDKSFPVDSQSCLRRIEAAKPAGPPPTINTSNGMLSRGSSRDEKNCWHDAGCRRVLREDTRLDRKVLATVVHMLVVVLIRLLLLLRQRMCLLGCLLILLPEDLVGIVDDDALTS